MFIDLGPLDFKQKIRRWYSHTSMVSRILKLPIMNRLRKSIKSFLKHGQNKLFVYELIRLFVAFVKHNFASETISESLPYTPGELIVEKAIKVLREVYGDSARDRLFIWIHLMDLHDNGRGLYIPPPSFLRYTFQSELHPKHYERFLKYVRFLKDFNLSQAQKYLQRLYYASAMHIDYIIRKFILSLKEFNIDFEHNALIIITGDHGEHLGEHGKFFHAPPTLYEQLIKVPLIILGPNIVKKSFNELTSHIDIAPTILDLLGIPIPRSFHGTSLKQLLLYRETEPRDFIISEYWYRAEHKDHVGYCYLKLPYKLIVEFKKGECSFTLINLEKDPIETENLILIERDIAREYVKRLLKHMILEGHVAIAKKVFDAANNILG